MEGFLNAVLQISPEQVAVQLKAENLGLFRLPIRRRPAIHASLSEQHTDKPKSEDSRPSTAVGQQPLDRRARKPRRACWSSSRTDNCWGRSCASEKSSRPSRVLVIRPRKTAGPGTVPRTPQLLPPQSPRPSSEPRCASGADRGRRLQVTLEPAERLLPHRRQIDMADAAIHVAAEMAARPE